MGDKNCHFLKKHFALQFVVMWWLVATCASDSEVPDLTKCLSVLVQLCDD